MDDLGMLILYLGGAIVSLLIFYYIVRAAVRDGYVLGVEQIEKKKLIERLEELKAKRKE